MCADPLRSASSWRGKRGFLKPAPGLCRQWIAEENRHGDVLGRYLYLSGRVDMKQGGRGERGLAAALGSWECLQSLAPAPAWCIWPDPGSP